MAYQTGTLGTPAALKTALLTFAAANGWTRAGDVLNNANGYVRLTALDNAADGSGGTLSGLLIEGCNDASFAGNPKCANAARIAVDPWPLTGTYHLFAASSPAMIWLVINYNVTTHQYLVFGDGSITANTPGGNFFAASHGTAVYGAGVNKNNQFAMNTMNSGSAVRSTQSVRSAVMFWGAANNDNQWDGGVMPNRAAYMHIEIDGHIWPGDRDVNSAHPTFTYAANPLHTRMVSSVDDELVLLPYWLALQRPDGYYSDIGYLPHLRAARLDNHAPGDVLTIGTERWKIFPWYARDPATPNGYLGTSGLWGYAVRYDGP